MAQKKRNAADLTARNNNARKREIARLERQHDVLVTRLEMRLRRHAQRFDALEELVARLVEDHE